MGICGMFLRTLDDLELKIPKPQINGTQPLTIHGVSHLQGFTAMRGPCSVGCPAARATGAAALNLCPAQQ